MVASLAAKLSSGSSTPIGTEKIADEGLDALVGECPSGAKVDRSFQPEPHSLRSTSSTDAPSRPSGFHATIGARLDIWRL